MPLSNRTKKIGMRALWGVPADDHLDFVPYPVHDGSLCLFLIRDQNEADFNGNSLRCDFFLCLKYDVAVS